MTATAHSTHVITLYEVDRCYGGPEEGGWWYDWYELVPDQTSRGPLGTDAACDLRDRLNAVIPKPYYDRYSVLGGSEREWIVEDKRGTYVKHERPHYE